MAGLSRTSASLLAGLALVCVLGAVGWWVLADEGGDCPVAAESVDAEAQLVDAENLLPEGSVGERREDVVDGLSGLGPLGEVESGRFYDAQADVPALVPSAERLVLVTAPPDEAASLSAVDLAGAPTETAWAAQLAPEDGRWTSFTGGPVGDHWVAVFSGQSPAVLALDEEGQPAACVEVPLDSGDEGVLALTDQAGADVAVLASADTAGWWLGVVDPAAGEVVASAREESEQTWEDVKVTGDLVVGSRWRPATVGTAGAPGPADADEPWIQAWGLDGEERWVYPSRGRFPAVLLDLDEVGTSYVVSFDGGGPWLDAVGRDGQRQWRTQLRPGEWSGSLWEDVVVLRSPDPRGGPMLRAFDARDGGRRWTVRARRAPPVGEAPRASFGDPLVQDDAWWVPSPNGLLRIDRGTDAIERVDSEVTIDQLLQVGDAFVVRSGPAVLVTD